jgi:predicted N-acyltransferase
MQLRGKNYPIPLSGTIWIEPQSGAVVKLVASMESSLSDLGLQAMRSEIHYATVHFHDPDESYWMPVSAVIDVETQRQHWRNIHRFAGYKRFRATIQVEEAERKP